LQRSELSAAPSSIVAIVEDELILREEMAFQLQHMGFEVETFENAAQLYRRLAVVNFDSVILDIGLDGEDGLSICQYLREHDAHIGIVFATARGLREDRLLGLDNGADAYLIKPVDLDELVLILRRLEQRASPPLAPATTPKTGNAKVGDWCLDATTGFLTTPAGLGIRLSLSELQLLGNLMKKPEEISVHNELSRALGMMPEEFNKHRIEVILSRLREKVRRETGVNLPVLSKRGLGYMFSLDAFAD
jgi:DNA-binding response OmpR family regulator